MAAEALSWAPNVLLVCSVDVMLVGMQFHGPNPRLKVGWNL